MSHRPPTQDTATAEEIRFSVSERRGMQPESLTQEALQEAGCMRVVCVLPQDFHERVQYLGNMLSQMTMDTKGIKDDRLRLTVGTLAQTFSYLLNSCSWREKQLLDFDYDELQRKLGRFVRGKE